MLRCIAHNNLSFPLTEQINLIQYSLYINSHKFNKATYFGFNYVEQIFKTCSESQYFPFISNLSIE